MAPARQAPSQFSKDEKVLCFHLDMLYEAKITDVEANKDGKGHRYKVHYKGWKNTWDDWVRADRIRPFDDEHRELAAQLHAQLKSSMQKNAKQSKKGLRGSSAAAAAAVASAATAAAAASSSSAVTGGLESGRGSEERGGSVMAGSLGGGGRGGGRRGKDWELETEDSFHNKPMINIPVPDQIQALLVDDWENITKNNQLVPLPHSKPVSQIFDDYLAFESPHREPGSAASDILQEVISGFREYFMRSLSRILLYRFERHQYMEIRRTWENRPDGYKEVCNVYGAEHLARLIVSLPELLAQTNMDHQSVSRLREEIGKFTAWLSHHCETYFVSEYEVPSQDYIDKARSF